MAESEERPLVWVIVLNWNGAEVIEDCLESLLSMDYPRFHVLVVDNASSDGSAEIVARDFPDARLLRLEENRMYAGGNNAGIEPALAAGASAVMLVNNDTRADERLLSSLMDALSSRPGAGAAGPKIFYHDQPDRIWSYGGRVQMPLGLVRHIGIRKADGSRYDSLREVDYLTGCCLLIRSEALRSVGFLDTSYTIYGEDVDWCLRARSKGWKSIVVPGAHLWHKVSHSSGGGLTPFKAYYKMRSNVLLFRRFARPVHWITWPAATAALAAAMAGYQAIRGRFLTAREFLRGWVDGFRGPGGYESRGRGKEPK